MVRIVSRIFLALVILGLIGIPAGSARAQQNEQQDARDASAAAEQILNLAVDREFNAMYDSIHPDAYRIIPRAAAVGAFTEIYDAMKVGDATITNVEMGPWTWGVTGQTYDYAAGIDFSQAYVDENGRARILEDTMYLVKSEDRWRWFFGSDPSFVQDMIDKYGQEDALPQGEHFTEGDFLQNVVNDLDEFYRDVLSYTGVDYVSPGVVLVAPGDSVMSACGPASSGFWGFYCPPDQTLYLEEALLSQLIESADFAAAFVIAHEWAHHIQTELGFERTTAPDSWNQVHSIELELMADCFAGAWAVDADTRGRLEPDDVREAMAFTVERLGDPAYIDDYDPQAHGSAEDREFFFMNGYNEGFSGCNVKL
jgi:predicted metalloprotease